MTDDRAITPRDPARHLDRLRSRADGQTRGWLFTGADELFRSVYTHAGFGPTPEVVAVSSALRGEGKTTISLGLATTVAQDYPDRRVVLVETDFEHPTLASDFEVENTPGLVDCVLGDEPFELSLRSTYLDNLHLLPVGGPVPSSGRVLRASRMARLIDALRQNYDMVVIDAPSVLVNSDALMLFDLTDGMLLVVRSGVTPAPALTRALEYLEDGKVRGVVLNGSRSAVPGWMRRLFGI